MFSNGNPMGEKIVSMEDEVIISDDAMIAECFNTHFVNITDSLGWTLCLIKYLAV